MHFLYETILPYQINDIPVTLPPPDNRKFKAYGGWLAMHFNEWSDGYPSASRALLGLVISLMRLYQPRRIADYEHR